jgi:hypothetical protein
MNIRGELLMTRGDFNRLVKDGFTSEIKVELIKVKIRYEKLRDSGLRASEAMDLVQSEFPHIQYETVRRKIYQKNKKEIKL